MQVAAGDHRDFVADAGFEQALAGRITDGRGGEFAILGIFFERRQMLNQHDRPPVAVPKRAFKKLILQVLLRIVAAEQGGIDADEAPRSDIPAPSAWPE